MAISINWQSKVISIPRIDLTLIQASPVEIRELNLNLFRLNLKDLEDDEAGMSHIDTHQHNTETLLGGIVFARVIEIINGYTVTFEDGQYSVNLVGANSNVGDVVNANQVSIRSSNSAGLISNQAIEFSSFNGGVTIDQNNTTGRAKAGTVFPSGTDQSPVDNLSDLALLLSTRGFNKVYVKGDLDIDDTASWVGHEFVGESSLKSLINIQDVADVFNCEFYDAQVTGTLDGSSQIERSLVSGLDFVDGFIFQCAIGPVDIKLGTSTNANIFSSFSTVPGNSTPEIDMNETGILALRDYNGGILLKNYIDVGSHSIDMASGQIKMDKTITSGTFVIRGVGKLIEADTGNIIESGIWNSGTTSGVTIVNELLNVLNINKEPLKYANADEVKEADGTLTKYESGTQTILGDQKTISEDCTTGEASIIKKV